MGRARPGEGRGLFVPRLGSNRALDLSDTLILVPNGEAGRRLREALAQTTN
jgi:hypothetical protein